MSLGESIDIQPLIKVTLGVTITLKPSITVYNYKGHQLRFSKSGNPNIEIAYSTHLVLQNSNKIESTKKS